MYGNSLGLGIGSMAGGMSYLLVIMLWSLFWKGLALWHSSRRGESWWFIALLILNTVGILEIVYLFVFAKLSLNTLFTMGGPATTAEKVIE